jgi:hypothetical protein
VQPLAVVPKQKCLKHKLDPTWACSAWERTPQMPQELLEPPLLPDFFLNAFFLG